MVLTCLQWSESAWEAPWVFESLVAVEQRVSASQTVWAQVALASLTVARAEGLSIQGNMGADGSGFFDGLLLSRNLVLTEFHVQLPDYFLSTGIYG